MCEGMMTFRVICDWCADRQFKPNVARGEDGAVRVNLPDSWIGIDVRAKEWQRQFYFCGPVCEASFRKELKTLTETPMPNRGLLAACAVCRNAKIERNKAEGRAHWVTATDGDSAWAELSLPEGWAFLEEVQTVASGAQTRSWRVVCSKASCAPALGL